MAKFNSLFSRINPNYSPEEMEALAEPSIMDEYIKQNDPEQYDRIQGAKNIKFALDSAMNAGPVIGSLKNVSPIKKLVEMKSTKSPTLIEGDQYQRENLADYILKNPPKTIEEKNELLLRNYENWKKSVDPERFAKLKKWNESLKESTPGFEEHLSHSNEYPGGIPHDTLKSLAEELIGYNASKLPKK
jgi:hypothetical protein